MSGTAGSTENTPSPARADDSHRPCPACQTGSLSTIYRVQNIPVHNVLLMSSRSQAVDYPRGDLNLGFCDRCGFLSNTVFDPSVHEYSTRYEETQGFSPTFNAFARGLAEQLVERHELQGKTVLEIGCGKGDFLALLCELADADGIGLDPAYVPERMAEEHRERVNFIQDFYGEKYADLEADFICCRHTLEHIAPTYEFMRSLRRTIGDRRDTTVFFELPDVLRVLEEGAFWDIYYEHCSYFTTGSLARLFRATGFDVIDLEVVYDKQYLLITAMPSDRETQPELPLEDDLALVQQLVHDFPTVVGDSQQKWRDTIAKIQAAGERAVLWGAGSKGVAFLTTLGLGDEIAYCIDINPYKQGKFMPGSGHEVAGPERLAREPVEHIFVMNPVYMDEIGQDLARRNIAAQLHPV